MNSRLSRLRRKFKDKKIDAILISQPENRRYISGFSGSDGHLFITQHKAILATDFRYVIQAEQQAADFEILKISSGADKWLPDLAAGLGLKNLGFEATDVSFSSYNKLGGSLAECKPGLKLIPLEGIVESLRILKEPAEIEAVKKAVAVSDAAMGYIIKAVKPGMTEIEAAWMVEEYLRRNGSQPIPFDIIVASGPNAAMPHAIPSEKAIKSGEPVIIDMGARVDGYTSDISRTICPGKADGTFKKIYSIVLKAQQAAIDGITNGTSAAEADNMARRVIEQAGYGKEFGHSLGHGVGLAVHERPGISPVSEDKLVNGMTFTIEPGIYIPGWGGVRIEDTVLLKNGKIEALSKVNK